MQNYTRENGIHTHTLLGMSGGTPFNNLTNSFIFQITGVYQRIFFSLYHIKDMMDDDNVC